MPLFGQTLPHLVQNISHTSNTPAIYHIEITLNLLNPQHPTMSIASVVQPTTEIAALPASQQAHTHQPTQNTSMEDVHYIAQGFDERDWDAVMILYHAGVTLRRQRERKQREHEQIQRAISTMKPGEAGPATNNSVMLNKLRSPKKARSCTRRAICMQFCSSSGVCDTNSSH